MQFNKPPLSYRDQLERLQRRGLIIDDWDRALRYLAHLNYYRLGAYWLPFEVNHATHQFQSGTQFDQVLNLYIFDRELRLLVMDAMERIEVSIRANWAYHMAHEYGAHCHLKRDLFSPKWNYDKQYKSLWKTVEHSSDRFVQHFRQQYDEPLPPIWALVEIMTFGQLSQWYGNTAQRKDRNAVARLYGLDESILASLMHHLTIVRNICAHHGRLWNRQLPITPTLPKRGDPDLLAALSSKNNNNLYNTFCFMLHLMDKINRSHGWGGRLIQHLKSLDFDMAAMGFPADWQSRPLWDR